MKAKVEDMQLMFIGSRSIIGNMFTSEEPGYSPVETLCIYALQTGRDPSGWLKYNACQMGSRLVSKGRSFFFIIRLESSLNFTLDSPSESNGGS